ncbi:hypothetical protein BJV74DRAFT_808289, partial [Russula compacta]
MERREYSGLGPKRGIKQENTKRSVIKHVPPLLPPCSPLRCNCQWAQSRLPPSLDLDPWRVRKRSGWVCLQTNTGVPRPYRTSNLMFCAVHWLVGSFRQDDELEWWWMTVRSRHSRHSRSAHRRPTNAAPVISRGLCKPTGARSSLACACASRQASRN